MAEDLMRYDLLAQEALRGVVRAAIERVVREGLPGNHHFFISFSTLHPGVAISDRLRKKYENEMTIVLQHQFWDLKVLDEHFEITLSFSGVSQHLSVPFAAVTAFADPHAKFGLQFHVEFEEQGDAADEDEDDDAGDPPVEDIGAIDSAKVTQRLKTAGAVPPAAPKSKGPATEANEAPGKVVTLDAFRKK